MVNALFSEEMHLVLACNVIAREFNGERPRIRKNQTKARGQTEDVR